MITYPRWEDFVFYEGTTFTVEWYYTAVGRMPGREHFFGLGALDKERLEKLAMHIADSPLGTMFPRSMYRLEDPAHKIYAMKPRGERYFNFMTDARRLIITNAYSKHSQKMGTVDLDKLGTAAIYREDYLRRTRAESYYER